MLPRPPHAVADEFEALHADAEKLAEDLTEKTIAEFAGPLDINTDVSVISFLLKYGNHRAAPHKP